MATRALSSMLASMMALVIVAPRVEGAPMRRFAILVGNNTGGPGVDALRYAEDDATKLRDVLTELGGYGPGEIAVLTGETAEAVFQTLASFEKRIQEAKERGEDTSLLLYYSGHAKAGELWMSRTRLPMTRLRSALGASRADMRMGIIDACESGSITREKGARRGPSFLFESDDREPARGLILISSSSDRESSQESDELGGSFFTHYLASGLRGDADESGDRRVTLGEVYAYTYHKTVNVTVGTRAGAQHPTYSYDLEGNGDIVLTDLSEGRSGIHFDTGMEGDFLVFDLGRDRVAAEIRKSPGKERRLALPAGEYAVKKRLSDHLRIGKLSLDGQRFEPVREDEMERVAFEDDFAKGPMARLGPGGEERGVAVRLGLTYQSFLSSTARRELFPPLLLFGVATDVGPLLGARLDLELLVGGRATESLELGDLHLAYDFLEVSTSVALAWSVELGPLAFFAGPRLQALYLRRSFPGDELLADFTQDHLGFSPGICTGADLELGAGFSTRLDLRLGVLPFSVDHNRTLLYTELGLGLRYRP